MNKKQWLRELDQLHAELADIEERMRHLEIVIARDCVQGAIDSIEEWIEDAGYSPGQVP